MYRIELEGEDIQLAIACIIGMVRRSQSVQEQKKAIEVTTAAAEVISRLNAGMLNHVDVRYINTAIQKTVEATQIDTGMTEPQKRSLISWCETVQNKLAGVGASRVSLNA